MADPQLTARHSSFPDPPLSGVCFADVERGGGDGGFWCSHRWLQDQSDVSEPPRRLKACIGFSVQRAVQFFLPEASGFVCKALPQPMPLQFRALVPTPFLNYLPLALLNACCGQTVQSEWLLVQCSAQILLPRPRPRICPFEVGAVLQCALQCGLPGLFGLLPPHALQPAISAALPPCSGSSFSVLRLLSPWAQALQFLVFTAERLAPHSTLPFVHSALGCEGPPLQALLSFSHHRAIRLPGEFSGLIGVVLARGLREVSVALGPPPCLLPFPQHTVLNPVGSTISSSTQRKATGPVVPLGAPRPPFPFPIFGSNPTSAQAQVQTEDWLTPCFPFDGRSEPSHVSLPLSATSCQFCRGQRETSVALGSPPANDFSSLMWGLVLICVVQGGSLAAAFLVTTAAIHLLVLWRMLLSAIPGGRSPLKSLLCVPCAKVPTALVLPWGYACRPACAGIAKPRARCVVPGRRPPPFWFRVLVLLGSLPVPIWAVPQDVASALTEAHAVFAPDPALSGSDPAPSASPSDRVASHPDSLRSAPCPEDLPAPDHTSAGSSRDVSAYAYRAAVEADIATQGSSSCLQAQPGLCLLSPGIKCPGTSYVVCTWS